MLPLDRESLLRALRLGASFEYLPFYGHAPEADGRLGDGCFSQWYEAPFDLDGVTYPTAEHWMMAEKARLFGDDEALAAILAAPGPAQAKKLGRSVRGFDEGRWRDARFDAVTRGNVAKFSSTPELRAHLLGTGELILVEASPRDTIWGVGLSVRSHLVARPDSWRGENLLGFALVRARAILRGELPAL